MTKFFSIFLSGCLILISSVSPILAQNQFSHPPPKIPASNGQKFVPNQILVKFKSQPQVSYQEEISIPIPFSQKKILLRQAGWAIKGMSGVTNLNKKLKIKSVQKIGETGEIQKMAKIQLPKEIDLLQAIANYAQDQDIIWAEPNYIQRVLWIPNDHYFSANPLNYYQWNLARINMPQAWNFEPRGGSSEIKVAVIDSGAAFENFNDGQNQFSPAPELSNVSFDSPLHIDSTESCDPLCLDCQWRDQPETNPHPNDDNGHGTHITGTITQMTNNHQHAAGIAFKTTIIPIKAINYCGLTTISDVVMGIDYAIAHGAKVINLSLGGDESSQTCREAIIAATEAGAVVVSVSGNEATRTDSPPIIYPGAYPEAIAVGATRWDNRRANYSNYGPELDLVAPGGQTESDEGIDFLDQNGDLLPDGIVQQTFLPDDFSHFTSIGEPKDSGYRCGDEILLLPTIDDECGLFIGTSMAVAHVSAAAALIFSLNPNLNSAEVKNILTRTASKNSIPDYNENEHGAGLLDVAAALAQVSPTPTPESSPTPIPSPSPSPGYNKGDVNHDGQVNSQDLRIILAYYSRRSWPETIWPDTNDDGIVNGLDFGRVSGEFE